MKLRLVILLVIIFLTTCSFAFAYSFWGIDVGSAAYKDSSENLTFSGLDDSGIDYSVGGYKYTKVDDIWYGEFAAASPGENYQIHRKSDAAGLFFKTDIEYAHFMIITGSPQSGYSAPELGAGDVRQFGPGDLKIDAGGNTYGVGMRIGGLEWAVDPNSSNAEYKIINPDGTYADINSRDQGTIGNVTLNPNWARVGHAQLLNNSDDAYAFYKADTGTYAGSADVSFNSTGIRLGGALIYAYEISVPWEVLGMSADNYDFSASWRPDCGNDLIGYSFQNVTVPEPSSIAAVMLGIAGFGFRFRRR